MCSVLKNRVLPNIGIFDTEIKVWLTQKQNGSDDDHPKC